ncbi:von Willebrand factor type A domain-containing protein [Cnuella takakiae]|uniref:von Willebrand factor type A domain-containing protein n=1 Tax=Cnuella takakiae TaxID=1302690 RepID=A0A1M4TDJ2_9BACT|nr:vWA domain-containing protein [Cnuella takakiae]OLY90718.1 hypothetical protein BUE76_01500 [Cnuella takakiae]SHE42572.1 von Willebrand factor type A domain-containing protein [Cnuella takakiae]
MTQKTFYHIILDQSGSMQDCIGQTISGFNEQVQMIRSLQLRYPEQELLLGLTRFNHEVLPSYFAQPAQMVAPLDTRTYQPDGTTALYDAIGQTIQQLQGHMNAESGKSDTKTVVVILTDGHENASREYSFPLIRKMIAELEATGKWTFSYLGATLDAEQVAASLNIRQENSMYFDKADTKKTYASIGRSLNNFLRKRKEGGDTSTFLDKDL